ncbi:hypothetical protein CDAR_605811 [Caerostris darwini]|uniref:Uncharacterized protein n=1 Tax=Caerostris darwini TaxID=1538125 RepID=A0AAV4UA52_9ARAC|nr:hypothetical protein CDAR_605811 [Caerostris darwini]
MDIRCKSSIHSTPPNLPRNEGGLNYSIPVTHHHQPNGRALNQGPESCPANNKPVKADYTKSCTWLCSAEFSDRARGEKCPGNAIPFLADCSRNWNPPRQRKERYPLIFRENADRWRVSSKQKREK